MKYFWIFNLFAALLCTIGPILDLRDGKIDNPITLVFDSLLVLLNTIIAINNIRQNIKNSKRDREIIKVIDKL